MGTLAIHGVVVGVLLFRLKPAAVRASEAASATRAQPTRLWLSAGKELRLS